ncbi:MAG TPA: sigma factor-like helix-turn-helix DNA-binding protein [Candidatus Pacearchaeota archaeon]|nr:hypothetical protein [Candidatus Parcubacteria bacterium]HOU45606.1 sigma factor-like helix-turn-helix DNA-binding protein [Candidatus Pacearchaeota archaeon]HPM08564.1 sigma factor-like helix-turn-helix DNA-binding protein [Candidatus Pacearchaeota archaeon]HQI74237.1 sigma factor-like helix-turn-helix DNA-binding protein [Candidatus Pacearchaeota archaeon]
METNYIQLVDTLLKDIPQRSREVIERRFGLKPGTERETLEKIGHDFGITRERVRQIQEKAIKHIKESKKDMLVKPFENFTESLGNYGGLRREDLLLEELGKNDQQNHVFFLLSLGDQFKRFSESNEFHPLWATDAKIFDSAKQSLSKFVKFLKTKGKLVNLADYASKEDMPNGFDSWVGASRMIANNSENLYGLSTWPEVNPKNIKDKAYLILKKANKPLHFSEIYASINNEGSIKNVLLQSVHNELIRNSEFILIGRGIYALREWGYKKGWVKDILVESLKNSKKSLAKEDLIKEVLKQRQVKESTILLNLSDKKYFQRDNQGNYTLKC